MNSDSQNEISGDETKTNRRSEMDSGFDESEAASHNNSKTQSRLFAAIVFWLLCITLSAAGHRLYKFVAHTDRAVSADIYEVQNGSPLVWVGYGDVQDSVDRILASEEQLKPQAQLFTLPTSSFWIGSSVLFTLFGLALVWAARWVRDNGVQSLLGLFAGHCFWLGAIEFGLDATGRRIGLAGSLDVIGDKIVGTHSAGSLIQFSLVFLIPIFIGLSFHESNRCVVFQWFRQRIPLLHKPAASGRVENYAARTALQFFMTVWFCYVAVLWLADPSMGSFGNVALLLTLVGIVLASPYMVWRTMCQSNYAKALRYSVSGAVVTWTAIEIAASMQIFDEPWLSNSMSSLLVLAVLTIVLTGISFVLLVGKLASGRFTKRPLVSLLVVLYVAISSGGCSSQVNSEPETPTSVANMLREYDQNISAPHPSATEAMQKALVSPDSTMRAQAAIAFGKSREVNSSVIKQLTNIATSDDSKLAQIAALTALSKHGMLNADSSSILKQLANDPDWSAVVQGIDD